ncbi:phage tail tape measure protein [Clostridioides difficile]|nr:phage tail tape measure protein [Clostridioides difficile]
MADKTLQAIIKLRDEFSDKMKQVKQVTDSAKDAMKIANDTSKTYGDSMKTTGKVIDEVSKASNSTQSSTNGMNQSFSNTNGAVQKMSDSLKAYSEKMKEGALSMTAFGTAVLGLGKKAYKSYGEVKAGLNEVYIATGATGDGAKGLEKSFKNIASTSGATFEAIGGTLGEVNTRFGYTSAEAEKCTKQFIKFAKVNKIDAVRAVQLVSRAMGDAGVNTKEYSSTMDKLTTMAQASGISMEELATTLVQYGAPMRNLGLSFDESIALLGKWQLEGVNTTTALAGMKIAIGKWSSEGKNATKEFSKTVEAIKSCKDPAEATGMAIEAFGQRAGPDLVDAIRGGKFDYQKYVEMIKNSGGTVDNTAKQIATAGSSIKTIMNSVKLLWGEFGAEINSVFAPAMKVVAEQISKVTKWFMDLSPEAKDVISTIAGVVLAFGAYSFVVGSVLLFTGKILPKLSKLGITLKFLTNPASLVVLGILALAGAFLYAYKHSETFRNAVNNIGKNIKEFVSKAVNFFTQTIPQAWESLCTSFSNVETWFVQMWNNIKQTFINGWNAIVAFFTQTIPTWINNIGVWFGQLPAKIGYALGFALGKIIAWYISCYTYIFTNIPIWINTVVTFFAQLPNKIWVWLVSTVQKIGQWGIAMLTSAQIYTSMIINNIVTFFTTLPGRIWTWLTNTVQKVVSWGSQMATKGKEGAKKLINTVVDTLKSLPKKVMSIGTNIVKGLWEGITGAGDWLKGKVGDFANSVISGFKNGFGVHSPSWKLRDLVGKFLPPGIWNGIKMTLPKLETNITGMVDNLVKRMYNPKEIKESNYASKYKEAITQRTQQNTINKIDSKTTNNKEGNNTTININLGGVTVKEEADINKLTKMLVKEIKLGIAGGV